MDKSDRQPTEDDVGDFGRSIAEIERYEARKRRSAFLAIRFVSAVFFGIGCMGIWFAWYFYHRPIWIGVVVGAVIAITGFVVSWRCAAATL